jgi:hypothetical protein
MRSSIDIASRIASDSNAEPIVVFMLDPSGADGIGEDPHRIGLA